VESDTRLGRSERRLISEDTPMLERCLDTVPVRSSSGDGVVAMQKFSARQIDLRGCSCRSCCALQVIACGRALDAVPRNADAVLYAGTLPYCRFDASAETWWPESNAVLLRVRELFL
jgi:hypothetical protein